MRRWNKNTPRGVKNEGLSVEHSIVAIVGVSLTHDIHIQRLRYIQLQINSYVVTNSYVKHLTAIL